MFDLKFRHRVQYPAAVHIALDIALSAGTKSVRLPAKIDTGATSCIFQRNYAEVLDIAVEDGEERWFSTANGRFAAFGHSVNLRVAEVDLGDAVVYFAADESFRRNVLGLHGFVDRIQLAINHHDSVLWFSRHDD